MDKMIKERLQEMADEKYKKFHSSLCPETTNILGVRVPILRKYAKELYKEYNTDVFDMIDDEYYEEILLQGMMIGELTSVKKVLKYLEVFVPKMDNWAVCDITAAGLKIVKKNKKEFMDFINQCLKSKKEFEVRFALVLLLDYYIDEEHLKEVFKISQQVHHEGYYVKMANAWLLSICFIKFYDETKEFLSENHKIDDFTYNKALQKALESFRISDAQKEELRNMKR